MPIKTKESPTTQMRVPLRTSTSTNKMAAPTRKEASRNQRGLCDWCGPGCIPGNRTDYTVDSKTFLCLKLAANRCRLWAVLVINGDSPATIFHLLLPRSRPVTGRVIDQQRTRIRGVGRWRLSDWSTAQYPIPRKRRTRIGMITAPSTKIHMAAYTPTICLRLLGR